MADTPDKPDGNRPILTPKYSEKLERTKEDIKKGAEEIGLDKAADVIGKASSSIWKNVKSGVTNAVDKYQEREVERRAYREVLEQVASITKDLWSNNKVDDYEGIAKWGEMSTPAHIYALYPKIEDLQVIIEAVGVRREELKKQEELDRIEAERQAEEAEVEETEEEIHKRFMKVESQKELEEFKDDEDYWRFKAEANKQNKFLINYLYSSLLEDMGVRFEELRNKNLDKEFLQRMNEASGGLFDEGIKANVICSLYLLDIAKFFYDGFKTKALMGLKVWFDNVVFLMIVEGKLKYEEFNDKKAEIDNFLTNPLEQLKCKYSYKGKYHFELTRSVSDLKPHEKEAVRLTFYHEMLTPTGASWDAVMELMHPIIINSFDCNVHYLEQGPNALMFERELKDKVRITPSDEWIAKNNPHLKNIANKEFPVTHGEALIKEALGEIVSDAGHSSVALNKKFMKASDLGQSNIFSNEGNGFMLGELEGSGENIHFTGDGSLITVGAPSSGKSLCHVMQNLIDHKGSAIVLDIKGEIYEQTAAARAEVSDVYRYAPADVKNSHSYNPLEHITDDEDYFEAECRVLAHTIMHDNTDDKEDFWRKGARDILTAIIGLCIEKKELLEKTIFKDEDFAADSMMGVKRIASCENNEMLDITDLMKASKYELIKAQAREINSLLRGFGKKDGANPKQGGSDGEGAAKLFLSFKSVMNKDLSAWMNTATKKITNTSDWAPNELRERPITIYLCIPKNRVKTDGAVLNLLLAQHIEKMLQEEPKAGELPVLLMLDEFAQLGRMEPIINAIEIGRSYGIKTWILCQSMSQIEERYGKDGARTLLNSCAVENWMRISFDDAKMLADRLGTQRPLFSDKQREPSFEVDDLTGVDFRDYMITFASGEKPLKLKKQFYYKK